MRLGWAILISPEQTYVQQHFILLLGCIELLRRSMWAIFRVEWEWIKIQKKNSTPSKNPPEIVLHDEDDKEEQEIIR